MSRRQNKRPPPRQRGRAKDDVSANFWLPINTETPSFSQLVAPWRIADGAWFATHPARTYRVRLVMRGELLDLADTLGIDPAYHPAGSRPHVIVRRPGLGEPNRCPVLDWLDEPIVSKMADYEPLLAALFEIAFEKLRQGETWVSDDEINARTKKFAALLG